MELGADADITSALDLRNSRETKKHDDEAQGPGCWMNWSLAGRCLSLKPKVDSPGKCPQNETKSTKKTSRDKSVARFFSFSTNSNSGTGTSTPNMNEEMKISSNLRRFTFNELKEVTRNFRAESILGQGGFGCVYKGWLSHNMISHAKPGMGIPVAVKTLNHDGLQGHKEWLAEVNYLGELHHPNLVKLIGYCIEGDQRLLVYEFMPRGSLENHLFRRSLPLPWSIRMKIVFGAAKGLAFLHEEADRTVIFRDFKTSNILLDSDYNAKLSDFGLAKDGPEGDYTHVSTRVMGTYGYAAPEYVMTGHLTAKSDVYSFGVVLLELLTGRKAMDRSRPPSEHSLVEWARPQFADRRRFYRLMDPNLHGHFSMKCAERAIQMAARCLSRDPKARPLMTEVLEALSTVLDYSDFAISSPSFQPSKHANTSESDLSRTSSSKSVPTSPFRSNYAPPSPSPKNKKP